MPGGMLLAPGGLDRRPAPFCRSISLAMALGSVSLMAPSEDVNASVLVPKGLLPPLLRTSAASAAAVKGACEPASFAAIAAFRAWVSPLRAISDIASLDLSLPAPPLHALRGRGHRRGLQAVVALAHARRIIALVCLLSSP